MTKASLPIVLITDSVGSRIPHLFVFGAGSASERPGTKSRRGAYFG
jgi:hypothetical protein